MVKIVGIRFKKSGKTYYFDPTDIDIKKGDFVIVETVRGLEFGEVVIGIKDIAEENIVSPLKPVIRVATEEDKKTNEKNKQKEKDAFNTALKKIEEHAVQEVILALPSTMEGQTTIFYLMDALPKDKVKITVLSRGVPLGSELDYLDEGTLQMAFTSRS